MCEWFLYYLFVLGFVQLPPDGSTFEVVVSYVTVPAAIAMQLGEHIVSCIKIENKLTITQYRIV